MAERLYRAASAETLLIEPLDEFTLIFHRASGLTHLVAAPAPEIIAALDRDQISAATLLERLGTRYELGDASDELLQARLDELVAIGLVAAL